MSVGEFAQQTMAEGTRLKQMEMRMEALEFGMLQTHEAITQSRVDVAAMREELATSHEDMQRELERHREMMDQFGQRINNMFNMLSSLPQFCLPPEFPPRSGARPNSNGSGILPRPPGKTESKGVQGIEIDPQVRDFHLQSGTHTPMPRLEIPLFDGSRPR